MSHLRRISTVRWGWAVVGAAWSAFQGIDFSINKWCSTEHKALWNTYTLHIPFGWKTWALGIVVILALFIFEGSYRQGKQRLSPSSPRLSVTVREVDANGSPATGIVFTNVGSSEIQKLHIDDMVVAGYRVNFDSNIPVLDAHQQTHPIRLRIDGHGAMQMFYLPYAMIKDWAAQGTQADKLPEQLVFPCTATYEDSDQNQFQASWKFEFYPFKYQSQKNVNPYPVAIVHVAPAMQEPFLVVSSVQTKMLQSA
jgi:hypothetical protein